MALWASVGIKWHKMFQLNLAVQGVNYRYGKGGHYRISSTALAPAPAWRQRIGQSLADGWKAVTVATNGL